MVPTRSAWIAVAVLLLVSVLAFLLLQTTSEKAPPTVEPRAERGSLFGEDAPEDLARDHGAPSEAGQAREAESGARAALLLNLLSGRVLTETGEPIQGAEVTWTVLELQDLDFEPAWQRDDWGSTNPRRLVHTSRTYPDGMYVFDDREVDASYGSVLWATKPGFLSNHLYLPPGRHPGLNLRLEAVAPFSVVVTRGDEPVQGATVRHHGLVPPGTERGIGQPASLSLRRHLLRTSQTDAEGSAPLGSFPGEQVIQAYFGEYLSQPWRGVAGGVVELELLGSFQFAFEVVLPDWSHLDYVGERRVTVDALVGNLERRLLVLRNVEEGEVSSLQLPVIAEAERYRVRLEGSPIIPVQAFFDSVTAGESVSVLLEAELGHEVWIQPVDALSEEVVPGGEAKLSWREPDGDWNSIVRSARPDGYINIWSLPEGPADLVVSAEGYASFVRNNVWIPSEFTLIAELERAGRLRGRCLFEGEPVSDFEVIAWPVGDRASRIRSSFSGRKDGTFEMDALSAGEFRMTVTAPGLLAPEPLSISLTEGEDEEVVVELVRPRVGTGRVVDARTAQPIAGATVQAFVSGGTSHAGPLGAPRPVAFDGTIQLEVFTPGTNYLLAEAPGYGGVFTEVFVSKEESSVDFGQIGLRPYQSLEVRLRSEVPADFSRYRLIVKGTRNVTPMPFSSDGIAGSDEMAPGVYVVQIRQPDRDAVQTLRVELPPGEDVSIERWITGQRALDVQLVPSEAMPLDQVGAVLLSFPLASGVLVHLEARDLGPEGRVHFDGIEGNVFDVKAIDWAGETIAGTSGELPGAEGVLRLSLESASIRVRVLDGAGRPLSGTSVRVYDPLEPGAFRGGVTNRDGTCAIPWSRSGELILDLEHGVEGIRLGVKERVSPTARDLEVVLDAQAGIELRFVDGQVPLAGVEVSMGDSRGHPILLPRAADANGMLRLSNLATGSYSLSARKDDCWPRTLGVEARVSGDPQVVQLRRLGDLRVQLETGDGVPVAGRTLALTAIDTGEEVSSWLAAGRVKSAGLVSDGSGQVWIGGLPRGSYRWSLTTESGEQSGELVVRPGVENTTRIVAR